MVPKKCTKLVRDSRLRLRQAPPFVHPTSVTDDSWPRLVRLADALRDGERPEQLSALKVEQRSLKASMFAGTRSGLLTGASRSRLPERQRLAPLTKAAVVVRRHHA
jgi:hypothetical protein